MKDSLADNTFFKCEFNLNKGAQMTLHTQRFHIPLQWLKTYIVESHTTLTLTKVNTYVTLPVGFLLFSSQHSFLLTLDQKVFSRLLFWLSVKVWSFRLSSCYPHEIWYKQHFLSASLLFSLMLKIYPIFILHGTLNTSFLFIILFQNIFILFFFLSLYGGVPYFSKQWVKGISSHSVMVVATTWIIELKGAITSKNDIWNMPKILDSCLAVNRLIEKASCPIKPSETGP